jgi:hypothetical protein
MMWGLRAWGLSADLYVALIFLSPQFVHRIKESRGRKQKNDECQFSDYQFLIGSSLSDFSNSLVLLVLLCTRTFLSSCVRAMLTSSRPTSYPVGAGVKRPGSEADHSPPTSAEAKKTWIYTSTPPYAFIAY